VSDPDQAMFLGWVSETNSRLYVKFVWLAETLAFFGVFFAYAEAVVKIEYEE